MRSITNDVMSRSVVGQPEPEIGMGVTMLSFSDRSAGTIYGTCASLGRRVVKVRADTARRTDGNGMSDCQTYEHTPNPDGATYAFRMTPRGTWEEVCWNAETNRYRKMGGGRALCLGSRDTYHDFSF